MARNLCNTVYRNDDGFFFRRVFANSAFGSFLNIVVFVLLKRDSFAAMRIFYLALKDLGMELSVGDKGCTKEK